MRRKILFSGAALLTTIAVSTVPASAAVMAAKVDAPVTITFYNYNLATAGAGAEATKKLLAEFTASHPNIHVNGVGINATTITSRLQADVVARRPVDVAQVVFSDLDFVAHNLGAKPLEDIVPPAELAAHTAGMVPAAVKLGVLDGKTFVLPYTISTPVLFYNTDIFKAAGLDPLHPPQTWSEIRTAGLAIKQRTGKVPFAIGMFGKSASDWQFQSLVRSNGGSVLSPDRKQLTFASPQSIEAIAMLRDLRENGVLSNMDSFAAMDAMVAGNVGMYMESSAVQNFLLKGSSGKFQMLAAAMPAFGKKPVRPNNSGSALAIMANDPVKQRAAWELVKFLTSQRGYTIITSEIGYLPLRPDIVSSPQYLEPWVKDHPLIWPNLKQLSVLEPWVPMPGPNYRQIDKTMMDGVESAVFGTGDVAATVKAAQETAQRLMPK